MIVDYAPRSRAPGDAFAALSRACDAHKLVCEGAWGTARCRARTRVPRGQKELAAADMMAKLADAKLPLTLFQIHAEPKRPPRA